MFNINPTALLSEDQTLYSFRHTGAIRVFEADILKLGYISFEDWSNSMDIMSDPRNQPYHGVKGLVYKKELQKRAEDALDKMTKLIES